MIRILLAAISIFASAEAFALETTTFHLSISREHIRDPQVYVTSQSTFVVRYDANGTCYVLGRKDDYVCTARITQPGFGVPSFEMFMENAAFRAFLYSELEWLHPEYLEEFFSLLPENKIAHFLSNPNSQHLMNPAEIELQSFFFKSRDAKTTYILH